MRFVNHHQVPRHGVHVRGLVLRELIRADHDLAVLLERSQPALPDSFVVGLGFQTGAGQEELLAELLMPLLPPVGWCDDQNPPAAFGPLLRDDQAGFDGLAEPYLVGQQHALREGRLEGEQRRFDLMRMRSTWASTNALVRRSALSGGQRRVSSWAKNFA